MAAPLRTTLFILLFQRALNLDIISKEKQKDLLKEYEAPMSPTDHIMLNMWKPIGAKLHEGDLLLTDAQKKRYSMKPDKSSTAPLITKKWPDNTVKYHIKDPGPSPELVEHATSRWSGDTCITFESVATGGHLEIKYGEGCYTQLGYVDGVQELVLSPDCESEPVLVHLLGHVLGLPHTHSRSDRDEHLYVRAHNGLVEDFQYLNSKDYSQCPFNYQSVMMYDTYGLSRSGEAVFLSAFNSKSGLMASSSIGIQDAFIPEADLAFANAVLGCPATDKSCENLPTIEPWPCDVNIATDSDRYQSLALDFNKMDRSAPNNCVWRVEYTGKAKCIRVGIYLLFEPVPDPERQLFLFSTGCRYFQVEVFDPLFEASQFYCGSEFVRKAGRVFLTGGVHPERGLSTALYALARFRATTGPVTWQYKTSAGDLGTTGRLYAFTVDDVYCSDRISPVAPCF